MLQPVRRDPWPRGDQDGARPHRRARDAQRPPQRGVHDDAERRLVRLHGQWRRRSQHPVRKEPLPARREERVRPLERGERDGFFWATLTYAYSEGWDKS